MWHWITLSYFHVHQQGSNCAPVQFQQIQVSLQDASPPGILLCDLTAQQPAYNILLEQICPTDMVHQFRAVVGQDRQLAQSGDCVELTSAFHEVNTPMFVRLGKVLQVPSHAVNKLTH